MRYAWSADWYISLHIHLGADSHRVRSWQSSCILGDLVSQLKIAHVHMVKYPPKISKYFVTVQISLFRQLLFWSFC